MNWISSWPGSSWQALMIFATRLSLTRNDHCLPLFTREAETHLVSVNRDVPVLQGRQAIADLA
jgi:hypothetical protein